MIGHTESTPGIMSFLFDIGRFGLKLIPPFT